MKFPWAWRSIALTMLSLLSLASLARAQGYPYPISPPPGAAAYAPAPWGYGPGAGYGAAMPAYPVAFAPTAPTAYPVSLGGPETDAAATADGCDADCAGAQSLAGETYDGLLAGRRGDHFRSGARGGHGLAGLLGLLAPYAEAGCCAPHWFDVHAEAVFLQRDEASEFVPFTSDGFALGGPPNIVLSSDSLDLDTEPGMRITGTWQTGPGSNLEITYLGLFVWDDAQQVTSNVNNLWSPFSEFGADPFGVPFIGYDDVDRAERHAISLKSMVNSVELNYRRRWVGPTCLMQGSWLMGYRYFQLRDEFRFDSFAPANPDIEGNPGFLNYETSAVNHMHGFQMGGDAWVCWIPGLSTGAELKAGVYGNDAHQSTHIVSNSIAPVFEEAYNADVAFLGELNVMASYRVSHNFTVRGGYMLMYADQVALGTKNFNPAPPFPPLTATAPPRIVDVDTEGDAFWHGWTIGAEYLW